VITDQIVAADTGGTFTDLVVIDGSGSVVGATKVSTTPDEPAEGIASALQEVDAGSVAAFLYGTTTATNALLQRKGARTALLTTMGFRDLLELRRQNRPSLYDWFAAKTPSLVPRELCFEIAERVSPHSESSRALDEDQARQVIEQVASAGVESVAISLLHSYRDDRHERRLAELLKERLPDLDVSVSSEVLPEIMEFERTCTTAANAYLSPIMKEHLNQLVPRMRARGLASPVFLMQSDGGLGSAQATASRAVQTVLSGPAAGVIGGLAATAGSSRSSFLTIDMGGTSFDIAYAENRQPTMSRETVMSGLPLAVPALEIHTLGAGGGSLAWVDKGGALRVGPASAGSRPGPACYGRGGELPTVTDANLFLGRLAGGLLGGRLTLDVDLAARAIEQHLARPLGISTARAARGVLAVVNAAMARGMHLMSIARGRDPRSLGVVGFGGAGPLHACELAAAIGSNEVIIPPLPGTTSAVGLALASVRRERTRSVLARLDDVDDLEVGAVLAELGEWVSADLVDQGIARGDVTLSAFGRFSYEGQRYQIEIPLADRTWRLSAMDSDTGLEAVPARFASIHANTYGYVRSEPLFLFSLGIAGTAPPSSSRFEALNFPFGSAGPAGAEDLATGHRTRRAWIGDEMLEATVLHRGELARGEHLRGPAVVEQFDSTTVVPPGWLGVVDSFGNLVLKAG
jgi:N-methylhydantoinase A